MSLKLQHVPIGSLRPNPWNPNEVSPEDELRIEESLKQLGGFFKPIVVRETEKGLEILGGEHRWGVAKKLGYTEVPIANVGAISDEQAKKISLVDNARYGNDDPLKLAEVLNDIGDIADIRSFLPMTEDELGSIFAANAIALDDLADLDKATSAPPEPAVKPSPTHQIMRFKVPVADVARVQSLIERTIRSKGIKGPDSLENAGDALVCLCNAIEE
jgi:ParB family chromosome partitioning protein